MRTEYLRRSVSERRVELLIVLVIGVFSKHILGEEVKSWIISKIFPNYQAV